MTALASLLTKTRALVDALSDEEANHGGLLSRETLVKASALRLELSRWGGRSPTTKGAHYGELNDWVRSEYPGAVDER